MLYARIYQLMDQNRTVVTAVFMAMIFIMLLVYRGLYKHGKDRQYRIIFAVIYAVLLLFVTIFSRDTSYRDFYGTMSLSLDILRNPNITWEALANIFMFMPLGILLHASRRWLHKFYFSMPIAVLTSLSIELLQLKTARGFFDVEDIVFNTLGAFVGWMLFLIVKPRRKNIT